MLKMEIELDGQIIENLGYDVDDKFDIIMQIFDKAGLIKEKAENGYFLYRGQGLNTDLAYIGLVANAFKSQDWFKKSCKKWLLLNNHRSKDGSFYIEGDWIEHLKEHNEW